MSQTKKGFKFISKYHRTTETLNARDLGHGAYIGVHRLQELPFGDVEEQIESLVMPKEEIPAFIEFLQEIVKDET